MDFTCWSDFASCKFFLIVALCQRACLRLLGVRCCSGVLSTRREAVSNVQGQSASASKCQRCQQEASASISTRREAVSTVKHSTQHDIQNGRFVQLRKLVMSPTAENGVHGFFTTTFRWKQVEQPVHVVCSNVLCSNLQGPIRIQNSSST